MANQTYYLRSSNWDDIIAFDDLSYTITQDNLSGLAGYPVEYDTTSPPGYIGSVVNSTTFLPREINLHVIVWGNGREELEQRRQRLINAVNPVADQQARFVWYQESKAAYYLDVVPAEGSPNFEVGTNNDAHSWECDLTLIAHDPTWHSYEEREEHIIGDRKGFKLPLKFPFTLGINSPYSYPVNVGNIPASVNIVITGAIYQPIVLENKTTNQKITIRKDVLEGETLTIDTSDDNLSVIHKTSAGVETNALHYCSVGSEFWKLNPGDNEIYYEAASLGAAAKGILYYRPRWTGR